MNDLNKLRQFYHSIIGLQKIFDQWQHINIDHYSVDLLKQEIDELLNNFSNIVPPCELEKYFAGRRDSGSLYNCAGIKSYLCVVLGRLKIDIDDPQKTPVTEIRDFSFINHAELRKILERDFSEIQRAYIAECWKSVIILCGGAIEAILINLLLANSPQAQTSSKAPNQKDITRWNLSSLIDVSVDLILVSSGVEKFSHALREYRNLVHPGREIRDKLSLDAEEAKVSLEVFNIVCRDLS